MNRRFGLLMVVVAALVIVPIAAHANGESVISKGLSSGAAPVASCGALGSITPDFVIAGGTVTNIVLSNVPAGCVGSTLNVNVTDGAGTSLASGGPVTVGSSTVTVPVSPAVATSAVATVRLSATGP